MPEVNSATEIEAEFHLSSVKLYFQNPSSDSSGRIFSETYLVTGTLYPNLSTDVGRAIGFERTSGSREMACGGDKTKIEVHSDPKKHPVSTSDAAHSLIYIIQEDEFHVLMMGAFPTKYGLDGQWIGGNRNDSYFYSSVDPGEHHLCAEWGVKFKNYATPVSVAKVTLQPGESYFFRARVVFFSVSGEGERSITLDPISPEEAKRLIENSAFSTSKIQ